MIPRIIHCCWLGGGAKTALAARCLESWRRFAPGWEIREWNDAGADAPAFVREALRRRKWAFASDWVRAKALYECGGVYFDFDFELVAPIDDLAGREWCAGQWLPGGAVGWEPGAGLALEKGSPLAKALLDMYASEAYSEETVGEKIARIVAADPSLAIERFPPEVFSPVGIDGKCRRTPSTRGIHHYAMAWAGPRRKIARWLSWHGMRPVVEALLALKGRRRENADGSRVFDIVHVCAGAEAGNGAAAVAAAIARSQAARGARVAFVSASLPPGTAEVDLSGTERIVFARSRIPVLRRLCFSWGMLRGLGRICRHARVVHVHCQWTFPVWWGAKCARGALVASPAGSFDPVRLRFGRLRKRIAGIFDRRCLRKAAIVHATSPREEEWIRAYEPRCGAICVAAPDADAAPPAPRGPDAGPLRVLYLGRRHPLKGLDLLEKAAEGLDVELRIEDSAFGAAREAAFAWCDVLCLPTRTENYGLVVAEALARGRPAITTMAAPWEALAERGCGWCAPVSAEGLRAALAEAAATPRARLAEMGARGREWILAERGPGSCAAALENALRRAQARGGCKPE